MSKRTLDVGGFSKHIQKCDECEKIKVTKEDLAEVMSAFTATLKDLTNMTTTLMDKLNNKKKQHIGESEDRNLIPRGRKYHVGENSSLVSNMDNGLIDVVEEDIPLFYGSLGVDEFLNWYIDVDKFFDVMDVPESKEVKMVAIRLKSVAAI
ncbi:hypothetical protein AgCh_031064 [Apium graveolens]